MSLPPTNRVLLGLCLLSSSLLLLPLHAETKTAPEAKPAVPAKKPAPAPLPPVVDTASPGPLRAAIEDLKSTFGPRYPRAQEFLSRLEKIEQTLKTPGDQAKAQSDLMALQKEALIANPLVSGQPLLYVARNQYKNDHHNTETMFQTGEINTGSFQGGGALRLVNLATGQVKTLWESEKALVRDPDVHFDGKRILVSIRKEITDDYHIYEMKADGSGLKQLTSAKGVFDIDPIYLPDESVVFTSSREPKYCMCNRHIMGNLFRMDPDGANIRQIGKNTLFEGHGQLMPDGRIMYDRWEYVDRNFGDAQGLWTVNPDGTSHSIYWKNNTGSPGAALEGKVIPGTQLTICTFSSCHDRPWGAIAIIDRQKGLDGRAPVVRTWPAKAIELVNEKGSFDAFKSVYPKYEDPFPLSDKYFLCARMTGKGEQMGICLIDVFGNELLIQTEEKLGCYDPMPLAPRERPPVIPSRRDFENREGYFYVSDVYQGTHMAGVKPGSVKYLRVVEAGEKRFWTRPSWGGQGQEAPAMNWHDFSNKRILGTVPVEADGSASFALPSDAFVFFQLLDENGMMIQSMRSGTMVQSGEWSGCVGCHDERRTSPPMSKSSQPLALKRSPSRLTGWYGPARDFNYVTEVQPVFDKHCVSCHDFGKPAGEKLNLSGDHDLVFNASYIELWRQKLLSTVGAGPAAIQPAGSWGSQASKLAQTLRKGHQNVKLSAEELDRVISWIDINAPYYPSYASTYPNNLGGRSPLTDPQMQRLEKLTGLNFGKLNGSGRQTGPQISFERPELSPCLGKFTDKNAPEYKEALGIIQAGGALLKSNPNPDSPKYMICEADQQREAKYRDRHQAELRSRAAIRDGKKVYDNTPN